MKDDFQWERTNYRSTFIHCTIANDTHERWLSRVMAFVQLLGRLPAFRITDNGYERFPGVLVTGIECSFPGHPFSVCTDVPGEIIVMHTEMPRGLVDPLCNALKECWQRAPAQTS